jgi:uncharacterized damage-inducible protein DinB
MSTIDVTTELWKFNRGRTLATLGQIAKMPDPHHVLGWRPGPGRAHIGWQLMHVAVTEELFATERLGGTKPPSGELVSRFRGGSTPDDTIPSLEEIRSHLDSARALLLQTASRFREADLATIPEALREKGWTLGTVLQIIAWHEAHHQGQAHVTLNLYQAAHQA